MVSPARAARERRARLAKRAAIITAKATYAMAGLIVIDLVALFLIVLVIAKPDLIALAKLLLQ
jgi:hypothetical protein